MIAYCGLDCEKCGAFIATRNNDDSLRAKVAEEWSRLFDSPMKPEHINCTGCRSTGVKTYYCDQLCEIRKCAMERSVTTCAQCPDFPCNRVDEFFRTAPKAKQTLEAQKKK